MHLANATVPSDRIIDGQDISSILFNPKTATSPHKFMWHYCGKNVTAGEPHGGACAAANAARAGRRF